MKWVTRKRPKIDRIACPSLIKNFVDKESEFIYLPTDMVQQKASELNKIRKTLKKIIQQLISTVSKVMGLVLL
jgi:hypothetical protein